MGPSKLNAFSRICEFPDEGFIDRSGFIWCTYCFRNVNHAVKSVIQLHIKSAKHSRAKAAHQYQKKQEEANDDSTWVSMVQAAVAANIPLKVFSHGTFRKWLQENLKHGDRLPLESTLQNYKINEVTKDLPRLVRVCQGKEVVLRIVESVDRENRKVVHVHVCPLGNLHVRKFSLVSTWFVQECTAASLFVDFILSTLEMIAVHRNQLVGLVSEHTPSMIDAGLCLANITTRLLHMSGWNWILNLCYEDIRFHNKTLDNFVTGVRDVITKSNAKYQAFCTIMRDRYLLCELPPTIKSQTRFKSWLLNVTYHANHMDKVKQWIEKEVDGTADMDDLEGLVNSYQFDMNLNKVNTVALEILTCIEKLESYALLTSEVWSLLETVKDVLARNDMPCSTFSLYLDGNHQQILFLQQVQAFDPRLAKPSLFENGKMPSELERFSSVPVPRDEIVIYENILYRRTATGDAVKFWEDYTSDMPTLAKAALAALTFPGDIRY